MQLLFTRSAQLVICCETDESEDKNQNYRQLLAGRNTAHWQLKDLRVKGISVQEQFGVSSLIVRLVKVN